jgi:hypothetical protein
VQKKKSLSATRFAIQKKSQIILNSYRGQLTISHQIRRLKAKISIDRHRPPSMEARTTAQAAHIVACRQEQQHRTGYLPGHIVARRKEPHAHTVARNDTTLNLATGISLSLSLSLSLSHSLSLSLTLSLSLSHSLSLSL